MVQNNSPPLVSWFVRISAAIAVLIGGFWLAAWLCGWAAQWSAAGMITVKTNMALCQLASGVALLLLTGTGSDSTRRAFGAALAALVFLVGILTLTEHLSSLDFGIDQLLATEARGAAATASPNRVGPPGSLSLALLGAGLLGFAWKRCALAPYFGLAVCLINIVPAVGFLYGIEEFYSKSKLTGIAWPTVVALFALGTGLVLARVEDGPMALLLRRDAGGALLRKMLPAVILIPLALGFLRVSGQLHGLYNTPTGTGLLIITLIVFFSFFLWLSAAHVSRSTAAEAEAHRAVRESEKLLVADLGAMTRLQKIGTLFLSEGNSERVLGQIVEAAIAFSRADFGNIQLLDPTGSRLRIVAHRGLPKWWIDFWNNVPEGQGACGSALERGERVIVEDIELSPIFIGTPALEIQRKAGVRACQSTLLVSRSGRPLGMFSTHYEAPHRPDDRELRLLDLLGQQAADIIDRAQHEEALRRSRDELEVRVRERTAELERKNQELQDFAFVASHDLSEPLRKIQSFGSLLEVKGADRFGEQEKDYVSRMTGAATRMQELLEALLRYSRVETKGEDFRRVSLEDVVRGAVSDLEVQVKEVGARVEIGHLPFVNGDPSQLRQLFQNLIANAVKYRRTGIETFIRVVGEESDGKYRVFVEDNGIGFDEKYLDKIFQPFQRLHGRSEYRGIGMGLAICKKIVERHGGTIDARSTPGEGSTFIVTLPP